MDVAIMAVRGTRVRMVVLGGVLLACGGKEMPLDPASPAPASVGREEEPDVQPDDEPRAPAPVPPGKLVAIPTDIDDPIAQAICKDVSAHRAGTFLADATFGVNDATSVSASIFFSQPGGSPEPWSGLRLMFHRPAERGVDPARGTFLHEQARDLSVGIGGPTAEIAPGTYEDRSIFPREWRSLCYADGFGAEAEEAVGPDIHGATLVITSSSATRIEGAITSEDGKRLEFDAPIAVGTFPKEGPLCCLGVPSAPGTPPKLAPKCPSGLPGSFLISSSFGFEPGVNVEVYLHERFFADGRRGVYLVFDIRGAAVATRDTYGESTRRRHTTLSVPLETPYPTIPPGTYDADTSVNDEDESCYPNGLGHATDVPDSPGGLGTLTVTSQNGDHIAGVLELPPIDGGEVRRLEFDTQITPTPADPLFRPRCCTE